MNAGLRVRPRVFALEPALSVVEILSRLRERRGLVALHSAAGEPRDWSLVLFDPLARIATPGTLNGLRDALARIEVVGGDDVPGPFCGGFAGALSYELGVAGERGLELPEDAWRSPRIAGGVYVDFIVRDERADVAWLVLGEAAHDDRPDVASRRAALTLELARPGPRPTRPRPGGPLVRHTSPEEHMRRIELLRERIAAGDLYQANLAHGSTRAASGHPLDWYARLVRVNPAPYMGYLAWDDTTCARGADFPRGALLSASPELFFECDGRTARTRPIKGTAARAGDPSADRAVAEALRESQKDRAELAMIVDLERNDLGRVARLGSVAVDRFPHLETYAAVHHLTADVTAELAPGRDAIDVLEALFPGGSITGAPKTAAMREIARLEGLGRGFFTGSLGFVDARGRAAWNILIRTLVWRPDGGGEFSFHVGGGITWSSDARAEERETLAKGAKLVETLEGDP